MHLLSHWNELGSYCITETLEMQVLKLSSDLVSFCHRYSCSRCCKVLGLACTSSTAEMEGVVFQLSFCCVCIYFTEGELLHTSGSAFHMAFGGEAGVGSLGSVVMGKWKSKLQVKGIVTYLEWKETLHIGHSFQKLGPGRNITVYLKYTRE